MNDIIGHVPITQALGVYDAGISIVDGKKKVRGCDEITIEHLM